MSDPWCSHCGREPHPGTNCQPQLWREYEADVPASPWPPLVEGDIVVEVVTLPTFAELVEQLESEGFRPGLPPVLSLRSQHADKLACRLMQCGACGHTGLDWAPFRNTSGEYRAVGRCPVCDSCEEI